MTQWRDEAIAACRDAFRAIRRYPGTAATSMALMAFGTAFVILATVLMWRMLVHPKDAAPRAEEMIVAKVQHPDTRLGYFDTFGWRFDYIARRQTTLDCWVASHGDTHPLRDHNGDHHAASVRRIGTGFRECWGLPLLEGREFLPEDHLEGAEKVAILDARIWHEVFDADSSLVDKTLDVGGESVRVVGISASLGEPDFGRVDLWLPADDDEFGTPYRMHVRAHGRPREGVSFEEVERELALLDADYLRENPTNIDAGLTGSVHRHVELRLPQTDRDILWASSIPFVGVFLLSCANASGLLLIQFTGRARETALRMVLGASRSTLVLRFVVEGLCLVLLGGVFGLTALRLLTTTLSTLNPDLSEFLSWGLGGEPWDASAFVVAPIVVFVATISIALFPGLTATRLSAHEVIQDGARSVGGGRRVGRVRDAIANFLVGLSYLLVVTSISLGTGLAAAFDEPLGYEARGLVSAHVRFPACELRQRAAREESDTPWWQHDLDPEHCPPQARFGEALAAFPFVERLAVAMGGPVFMGGHHLSFYAIENEQALPLNRRPFARYYEVEEGYFEVLGTRLVAGRFIEARDIGLDVCGVNLSESLAAEYGGPQAVLGKSLYTGIDGTRRCTVVGVVADMNMGAVPVLNPTDARATYISRRMSEPGEHETYVVRVAGDAEDAVKTLTEKFESVGHSEWELLGLHAVERAVADRRELSMGWVRMFGIISTVALLFAGLGIYGIVAYSVTVRRGEHALRMALGASRNRVVRDVIARQLVAVWPGLALGIVASLVATPMMAKGLDVPMAFDLVTGLAALAVISAAVVVAALLPALRAGSIDPWAALREE
jgi:putative ABC transport system permease protein